MTSIVFQNSDDTNLHDNVAAITESGLHWSILNNSVASSVTSVLDNASNLNITSGTGTITTTAATGDKIVLVQSPTTAAIAAYIMTVTT